MTNNKQQTAMKLYTEEQVREAIKMAREGVRSEDNIINSLNFIKPTIELPSDEEIQKESLKSDFEYTFRNGAKWMRNKIQGGEQ
jgi:hypothetical protein